ncbi:hypothetical protein R6Q57_030045 [Mikania cordata]
MPGNGVGDRVHNFFAQENLPQGLRSQDGNWPLIDNLRAGNQKQFGVSDSSPRNYNPQQAETERGYGGQHVPDQYIFNNTQTNARPEFARSLLQSHHDRPSSNGYMYERPNFHTRPDKENFVGVNTEYAQNNGNQRGSLLYESQQEPVREQPLKNPFRSQSSEAHGSFDLFGGQHQTTNQHPGLLQQPLQQSGFNDIQQLQQQLMCRKMQELRRQQNAINQASQFARQQTSGSLSHGLVNGTLTSDSSSYVWTEPVVVNPNWLLPEQQFEPSLHGVPVSSSRGPINQFPHNNSFPGNNSATIPEQNIVPNKCLFENTIGQGSNIWMKMEHTQQINAQSPSGLEFPAEMVHYKSAMDAAPLDHEEEKILFGPDDNIWEALGSSKNMTGGVSSLLDDNEFANSLPSIQSGSWSALMQSAVAETTSDGDVGVQEEWPDLNFHNPELPSGKHPYGDDVKHQTPTALTDINLPNMKNKHHRNMGFQHSMKSGFNTSENDNSLQQSQNDDWKRVDTAAILPSSNLQRGGNHSNRFSPNNHHLNYWNHADSSIKSKGRENSEITCRLTNKGPPVSESSFNSSDKEELNSSRKENSNDSYMSSSSHLPDKVGQREHLSSDAGDSRSLAGTKQNSSNQVGRKVSSPGLWKFQYHPMGNLDEDVRVPFGTKPVSLQHSRGLGSQDLGNFELPKSSSKGFVPNAGMLKGYGDTRFKGMAPGHLPNIVAPHDRLVGLSTSDKAPQPSQNMLELLHKVDQSRNGGIARHLNSLELALPSEIPEPENSDGSIGGHQRSHSSNSQGIGLQLGPPSQRLSMAMQAVKHLSLSQPQPSANSRGKGHAELSSFPPFQETSRGEYKNDRMIISCQSESQTIGDKMNLSRNHLQHHPTAANESFDEPTSHSLAGENLNASLLHVTSCVSPPDAYPKMLFNSSSKLPSQQASQPCKSQFNIVESNSLGQQNPEEQEAEKRRIKSSLNSQGIITSVGDQSTEKIKHGQTMNQPAEGNDSSTVSQKDLEAFGRSLKPNILHQQISLLNQMKAYKHPDNDPNKRVSKRLVDSDNLLHGQQVTSEMARLTMQTNNVDWSSGSLPSKEAPASNQNGPTSGKIENSHINPQMAPSWFDRHGILKSGQMSSQISDAARTVEQVFKVSGSLEKTAHDSKEPLARAAVGTSHFQPLAGHQLPPQPLQPSIAVRNLDTARPKRRKWSRQEIHSWLKEVSGSSKNLLGIWCVEDDGELIRDVPKPKRRIILATHIMQRLFPPPPTFLSTEATSNYESVIFYASRLALGDVCNLVSCVSHRELIPESHKNDSDRLLEDVEECMSKAKQLDSDFSRLDERASILDLGVECRDLERLSIINRFDKFHGRGQADGEAASLSSDAD